MKMPRIHAVCRWPGWALGCLLALGPASASPETARDQLLKREYAPARTEYERLLQARPDDARLAYNAGVAAFRQQDLEAAAKHFESVLGDPDLSLQERAYFNLGNTRFRQAEAAPDPADKERLWTDAARQYEAALGLNSADLDAQTNLGAVRQQLASLPKPPPQPDDGKPKPDSKDKKKDGDKDKKPDPSGKDPSKDKDQGDPDKSQDSQQGDPSKDRDGKDKQKSDGGKDGQKDGEKSKDNPGTSSPRPPEKNKGENPSKQAGKPQGPKDGKDKKEGGENAGSAGDKKDSGPEGGAGEGQGAGPEADTPAGQMAVRFAEHLLDSHKNEERALIWRPAGSGRENNESTGRRKTW